MGSLGKLRHRYKNGVKIDLTEVGCECVYCIQLAQDREYWLIFVNRSQILRMKEFIDQLNDCKHLKKYCIPWSFVHKLYFSVITFMQSNCFLGAHKNDYWLDHYNYVVCEIWRSHGVEYEDSCRLGCSTV
jgi:hypothetical protein